MAGTQDISFVQNQFDDLVARRGKLATWQAAYRCSCWNLQSGQPTYQCKACGGTGYLYQPPVTARIVLQGIDTKREFLPFGAWQTGDIIASIPNQQKIVTPTPQGQIVTWQQHPMWNIGIEDLVYLQDSEQRASIVLTRGQPLWKYPADTLPHPANCVVSILTLFVANPNTGEVTTFTPGVKGTDYTVSESTVNWSPSSTADYCLNGNAISFNPNGTNAKNMPIGQQYSVVYKHYPAYIVYMDLPQPRDQDGQHMPRRVVLRLKDVGAR